MKIEGKATITLTDIRTGEKKIYTHKNEITEFAAEYFRECGALNRYPLGSISSEYPIDDLFGGIMCFQAPIANASAQFPNRKPLYMPAGNRMIANATIDNQSNSPEGATELGQYDPVNSRSGKESRVYVYDWDTFEAVGDISAICLTTRAGGYIGAGNATSGKTDWTLLSRSWEAYPGGVSNARTIDSDTQSRLCALDIGNAQVGTITTTASEALKGGTVTINWYDAPISKLNPFENINEFKDYTQAGDVKTLNTPRRSETHTFTAASNANYARVMGGTGYILLVGSASASIQNGATVYARQIQKDGTVVPFSATIAGMSGSIPLNNAAFIGGEIINGALYLAYGILTGSSTTTRVKIASDGAATNLSASDDHERVFISNEKRVYIGIAQRTLAPFIGSRYFDTQTGEIVRTNGKPWNLDASYDYTSGLWNCYDSTNIFCCCGHVGSQYATPAPSPLSILRPPCNWLSTINNLENTITKTGTQTMKIQYTLTLYRAPANP